jgi:N-acetylglucosaminyldiphosphoundecaprenol N-acetyl-beta-D-mannosaminyltransferase
LPNVRDSVAVLGCRVDALDASEAVARVVTLAAGERPSVVVTLGTEMAVRAWRDARFRAVLNASALSLCDTVGVLYAARGRGLRLASRVTGVDLIDPLCAALAERAIPLFLLGSRGDTADRAATVLERAHPGLRIAGARDGYFADADGAAVAEEIRASGARIVLVGLGSPRQELWLADRLSATGCAVGIGVGGSFDVIAGNVRRAPKWWRRAGLEWLYRLASEPRRWRRQLALPAFVALALGERLLPGASRRYVA